VYYRFLAFDLETAKVQSPHLRDWKERRPLGISCAATYCDEATAPVLWYGRKPKKCPAPQMTAGEATALVNYLGQRVRKGYTIVTWNGIGFDFDILAEESGLHKQCKSLALGHVDMMFHVLCQLGFGVSLNSAARGMHLTKSCQKRQGSLIPRLWADGIYDDVFRHVARDVRTTFALATTCSQRGYLRWITRWGTGRMLRLPGGWRIACAAQDLPKPIQFRDSERWSRDNLTAWMRSIG
jgi:hypothetical protein